MFFSGTSREVHRHNESRPTKSSNLVAFLFVTMSKCGGGSHSVTDLQLMLHSC